MYDVRAAIRTSIGRALGTSIVALPILCHLPVAVGQSSGLEGVVDRLEGQYAVVEWALGNAQDVPVFLFDGEVREGDVVALSLHAGWGGGWTMSKGRLRGSADEADLSLPAPAGLEEGRRYHLTLSVSRPGDGRAEHERGGPDRDTTSVARRKP